MGIVAIISVICFLLIVQYSLMVFGVVKDELNNIERSIGWVPLLPFILMFGMLVYLILFASYENFVKWFELNCGWFFVNGRKKDRYLKYLREKYKDK
jgi:hypothetical protein